MNSVLLFQIPFSSLRDEFQGAVTEEERRQIEQSCDHFPVQKILVYLHEFILFFVRERGDEEKEFWVSSSFPKYIIHWIVNSFIHSHSLKESICVYAEEKEWKVPFEFTSHFPDGIKLSQCAAAWAVLAQQEHRINIP